MKRSAIRAAFVVLLVIFFGACAATFSGYGRLNPNEQLGRDLEQGNIPAGYAYYYSGPDDAPNAILGIADGYTLDSRIWKPVDLTKEKMRSWMQWITRGYGTSIRYRGADVMDGSGTKVGIWYSPAWNTMVQVQGTKVVVHVPHFDGLDEKKTPFSML